VSAAFQTASTAFVRGRQGRGTGEGADGLTAIALLVGLVAALVAGATIWLVLTEPVTVARALDSDEIVPLLRQLAAVLYRAVAAVLDYR